MRFLVAVQCGVGFLAGTIGSSLPTRDVNPASLNTYDQDSLSALSDMKSIASLHNHQRDLTALDEDTLESSTSTPHPPIWKPLRQVSPDSSLGTR